jgi:hypothetical protein
MKKTIFTMLMICFLLMGMTKTSALSIPNIDEQISGISGPDTDAPDVPRTLIPFYNGFITIEFAGEQNSTYFTAPWIDEEHFSNNTIEEVNIYSVMNEPTLEEENDIDMFKFMVENESYIDFTPKVIYESTDGDIRTYIKGHINNPSKFNFVLEKHDYYTGQLLSSTPLNGDRVRVTSGFYTIKVTTYPGYENQVEDLLGIDYTEMYGFNLKKTPYVPTMTPVNFYGTKETENNNYRSLADNMTFSSYSFSGLTRYYSGYYYGRLGDSTTSSDTDYYKFTLNSRTTVSISKRFIYTDNDGIHYSSVPGHSSSFDNYNIRIAKLVSSTYGYYTYTYLQYYDINSTLTLDPGTYYVVVKAENSGFDCNIDMYWRDFYEWYGFQLSYVK